MANYYNNQIPTASQYFQPQYTFNPGLPVANVNNSHVNFQNMPSQSAPTPSPAVTANPHMNAPVTTPKSDSNEKRDWVFPHGHSQGKEGRSNTEAFRAEIEERTRNGESCEQIADALIAKGVQTSSKAISRQRLKWGFRKRAPKKSYTWKTPQRNKPNAPPRAPGDPTPQKSRGNKGAKQEYNKEQITQMTEQGLTAEEIATIMVSRGMKLNSGASTIRRLQRVWKLVSDDSHTLLNIRYLSRRKAREQQKKAFENYAKELGMEDQKAWVEAKMNDPSARKLRKQLAVKLMGDAAPKQGELSNVFHNTGRPKKQRVEKRTPRNNGKRGDVNWYANNDAQGLLKGKATSLNPNSGNSAPSQDITPKTLRTRPTQQTPVTNDEENESESGEDLPRPPGTENLTSSAVKEILHRQKQMAQQTSIEALDDSDGDSDSDDGDMEHTDEQHESSYPPLMEIDGHNEPDHEFQHIIDTSHHVDDNNMEAGLMNNGIAPASYPQVLPQAGFSTATTSVLQAPEQAKANAAMIDCANSTIQVAERIKELILARSSGRTASGSLTGLPPSDGDIQEARQRFKQAAEAVLQTFW